MGKHFTSGLLAGVVAAVIWMAAADMAGITGSVGLVALVLLVVTTLIATVVAGRVAAGHQAAPRA